MRSNFEDECWEGLFGSLETCLCWASSSFSQARFSELHLIFLSQELKLLLYDPLCIQSAIPRKCVAYYVYSFCTTKAIASSTSWHILTQINFTSNRKKKSPCLSVTSKCFTPCLEIFLGLPLFPQELKWLPPWIICHVSISERRGGSVIHMSPLAPTKLTSELSSDSW